MPIKMPIPEHVKTQTQSLGQHDVYGPVNVARAISNAAMGIAEGTEKVSKTLVTWQNAEEDAEAYGAATVYNKENKSLTAALENSKMVDLNEYEPMLKLAYKEDQVQVITDENGKVTARMIPTYLVADQIYDQTDAIYRDNLTKNLGKRGKKSFIKLISETRSTNAAKVVKAAMDNRNELLTARFQMNFEAAILNMNPVLAGEILEQALSDGVISAPDYAKQYATIRPRVNYRVYMTNIRATTETDELDNIELSVLTGDNGLLKDDRKSLISMSDARRKVLDKERTLLQDKNYTEGLSLYIQGKLTKQHVQDLLDNDEIAGDKGKTLIGMIESNKQFALESDPVKRDDVKKRINGIRYAAGEKTVSGNAEELRLELLTAATGFRKDGSDAGEPWLDGDDYSALMTEIDRVERAALTSPKYQNSVKHIQATVGLLGDADLSDEKPHKVAAFNAFKAALDAHMDDYGADADPLKFVQDNRERFSPARFEEDAKERFLTLYPEYQTLLLGTVPAEGDTGGKVPKLPTEVGTREQVELIKLTIQKQYQAGKLTQDEAIARMQDLTGMYSYNPKDYENLRTE